MRKNINLTHQRIINQTIQQIKLDGYETISLRTIANQIGMTTGAFYKQFKNKDDLFEAVTIILSNNLTDEIKKSIDSTESPQEQLLKLADELLQKFQVDSHTMNFLFFNPVAQKILANDTASEQFSFYEFTMSITNQLHLKFPQMDPPKFFIQIWAFIQGYGLLITKRITPYDPDLLSSTLTSFLKV